MPGTGLTRSEMGGEKNHLGFREGIRAHSSVGQSHRLITGRSLVRGQVGPPDTCAPSRKYLGIRAPLQGAGPRKGFVARQGRPEARRGSAAAGAEGGDQYAAQASG